MKKYRLNSLRQPIEQSKKEQGLSAKGIATQIYVHICKFLQSNKLEFICYCFNIVKSHWLPQYNMITLATVPNSHQEPRTTNVCPLVHIIMSTGILQTKWGFVLKVVIFTVWAFSISSPLSYPVAIPTVYSFPEDTTEGAWSLMLDPHFLSLPFAPQSPPSLCGTE